MKLWVLRDENDGQFYVGEDRSALVTEAENAELEKFDIRQVELSAGGHTRYTWIDGGHPGFAVMHAAWNSAKPSAEKLAKSSRKARVKDQAKAIGQAALLGASMAAIDQVGELFLDMGRKLLMSRPNLLWLRDLLDDRQGREVVKLLMALSLHTACHQTSIVPKKELIARLCELQITISTMQLLGPNLAMLKTLVVDMIKIGEGLPAEVFNALPEGGGIFADLEKASAKAS